MSVYPSGIDGAAWRAHAWRNRVHSLLLLAAMGGFMALLGWLLWGTDGLLLMLAVGVAGVLLNPAASPRLVMRLYRARRIDPRQLPELTMVLSRLSRRAGLPEDPELYYVPSHALNAFTVGTRERSAVAVTDGLLAQLSLRELAGVLAHEISHTSSNDLWVMALAAFFSRATRLLSLLSLPLVLFAEMSINWFALGLLVIAPIVSGLARMALSRTREYDADLNAARLTGDPDGLAQALVKIERAQSGLWERIFMPGRRVPEPSLLRSHPDSRERVARLTALKPQLVSPMVLPAGAALPKSRLAFGKPVARAPRWPAGELWHWP